MFKAIHSRLSMLLWVTVLLSPLAPGQATDTTKSRPQTAPSSAAKAAPAEDISGMYSFLGEGEFLQITLEENGVTGYISRRGELESDRGAFLDQFFSKAEVQGHDVSFTTKPLHGVWFEFSGRYERGSAKDKTEDGYYILRGTLKQFTGDAGNVARSRSRDVEFKLLGQPPDDPEPAKKN